MTTEDLTAACAGKPALWEAVDVDSHRMAAEICGTCDFRPMCRTILKEQQATTTSRLGLSGTWAGELWNDGKRIAVAERRKVALPAIRHAVGACGDCRTPLPGKALYCAQCREWRRADSKARYDRSRKRSVELDKHLEVPCTRCGSDKDERCRTPNGVVTYAHYVRRAPLCHCGVPARPHSVLCETHRIEERREMHRQAAAARYAATKTSGAEAHTQSAHKRPDGNDGLETASAPEHNTREDTAA